MTPTQHAPTPIERQQTDDDCTAQDNAALNLNAGLGIATGEVPVAGPSATERILLAEEPSNSVATEHSSVPVLADHARELDRRLKRHNSAPSRLLTLEELQSRFRTRKPGS